MTRALRTSRRAAVVELTLVGGGYVVGWLIGAAIALPPYMLELHRRATR